MRPSSAKVGKFKAAIIAVVAVSLTTAILVPVTQYLNPTEVALTLLLTVLLSSTLFGSRAGFAASIAGLLAFNFFFLPPFYTLHISGHENWVAFGAFLITALIAGQLSGYARKRAEESEAQQRKIERLYEELKSVVEQVSEADAVRRSEKLKSALLDAVTHDLRTPLTSIKASVTTLLSEENEENVGDFDLSSKRELLQIIDEETDRLNRFIEGIIGIAKVEAGGVDMRPRSSSVEEIIGNAIERARNQLAERGLELKIENSLPVLEVDPASVSQVVFTLLDNAGKYSPVGSRIRLHAHKTPVGKLRIMVEDQGAGIPKSYRETVFDKFYRLGGVGKAEGLGLGLTIARGILESQGGRIWIEDGSQDFVTRVVCEIPTISRGVEQ